MDCQPFYATSPHAELPSIPDLWHHMPHQYISPAHVEFLLPDKCYAQVSWSGVQYATTSDAIAMYFSGDSIEASTPLKLKWALLSKTHLGTGAGSHRSALRNLSASPLMTST